MTRPEEAEERLDGIGFPLIVKSVAGGGGIGMHVCDEPAALGDVVERADICMWCTLATQAWR